MKRYDPFPGYADANYDPLIGKMVEAEDGDYVDYDDHVKALGSAALYLRWLRLAERARVQGVIAVLHDVHSDGHRVSIELRRGFECAESQAFDTDHDTAFRQALKKAEEEL